MDKLIVVSAALGLVATCAYAFDINAPLARYDATGASSHDGTRYTVLSDLSGNGRDLTLGQSLQPAANEDLLRGRALDCMGWGGTYAYGSTPRVLDRTFSVWVNRLRGSSSRYPDNDYQYVVNNFSGMGVVCEVNTHFWDVSFAAQNIGFKIPVIRGAWHLLTVTVKDGGARQGENALCEVKAYVDGELIDSKESVEVPLASSGNMTLANQSSWNHSAFWGLADDFRLYGDALTAEDVRALFRATKKAKLIAHFPMERIDVADGVRTTPNITRPTMPLTLGSLVSLTNGVVGRHGLFFDAPANVNETIDSYGTLTLDTVSATGDFTIMGWHRRDRGQSTQNGPRLFDIGGSPYVSPNAGTLATVMHNTDSALKADVLCRDEEWGHFAISFEYVRVGNAEKGYADRMRLRGYRNGVETGVSELSSAVDHFDSALAQGAVWTFASSQDHTRPFRGTLDDIRVYAGKLTAEDVLEVYRGAARVDAGEDFSVAGPRAELHGSVSPYSENRLSSGGLGEPIWALVSAPQGSEGTVIENPKSLSTLVHLPADGTYVFALSNQVAGLSSVDQVTVTRVTALPGGGAVVTPTVRETSGLLAMVEAVGAVPTTRVEWRALSGPGGVWFDNAAATNVLAVFSAPGTYTLSCTASDGVDEQVYSVEVTASGTTPANQFSTNLMAYWPFDYTGEDNKYDVVGNVSLWSNGKGFAYGHGFDVGVGGTYAARVANDPNTFLETALVSCPNGSTTVASKTVPTEEWHTVSLWMYHDGSDSANVYAAPLYTASYQKQFTYLPKCGTSTDFELLQQQTAEQNFMKRYARFIGPAKNLTNRWTHVVFQMPQHNTGAPEVWIDGEKLKISSSDVAFGRYSTSTVKFAGGGFETYVDAPVGATVKHFPGRLDEIRVYGRHLSESEIRYLYVFPTATRADFAPSVSVPLETIELRRKQDSDPLNVAAYADKSTKSLVFRWSVISGDPQNVSFSSETVLAPVVTVRKSGSYALQLVADDGLHKTYSEPVRIEVPREGMLILFK